VLPLQAGHDSCAADYSPAQSQMRTILAAGLKRAYMLDWIGATARTRGATIGDYLDVVDLAVDHASGSVNLIGDCQGAWLATIYAARRPERINTLTIAGAAAPTSPPASTGTTSFTSSTCSSPVLADCGGSSAKHAQALDAYADMHEASQRRRAGNQPGDPGASAKAVMRIGDAEVPPLRLFLVALRWRSPNGITRVACRPGASGSPSPSSPRARGRPSNCRQWADLNRTPRDTGAPLPSATRHTPPRP
jgi:pimeloyl-ACP methyl ester carboxylesterase